MTREELKEKLLKKMKRWEMDYTDPKQYKAILEKFDLIPDEDLFNYEQKDPSIYHFVNGYDLTPKRQYTKRNINPNSKKAYFKLDEPIEYTTEKAFGIVTGTNGLVGKGFREYVEWIPNSQVISVNDKVYLPAWLISKKGFWKYVDKDDKITR